MARIGDLLATLLRRQTPDGDPLPDAVLLDRFARGCDPAAFELLVWRHGPMVLAACRRVLKDTHSAEDAFQAVFLVMSRKAGSVRGSAAGWLHRVALRVCLRMKRRLPPLSLDSDPSALPSADPVEAAEKSAILDEEVARLPDWLRVPVILCYLQGHTTERAAEALGVPRGTVLSRLATARKRLAVRLTARGVALLVAAAVVPELSADAGRAVAESAVRFTLGQSTNSVPVQLALEVLAMTKRTTVAVAVAAIILTAGVGTGVGLVAAQGQGPKPTPMTATPTDTKPQASEPKKADDEAAARRELRLKLADGVTEVDKQLARIGPSDADRLRFQLRAAEQRLTETALRTDPMVVPVEWEEELARARERLAAAKVAPVPADVLAAAVALHPKVVEAQKQVTAKDDELQASNLPQDDARRKKLIEERLALARQVQAFEKQVGPELEAYLRVPGVVAADRVAQTAGRKVEQFKAATVDRQMKAKELSGVIDELRDRLARQEAHEEEVTWLKEKRKRLKQELLELELKELGVSKK